MFYSNHLVTNNTYLFIHFINVIFEKIKISILLMFNTIGTGQANKTTCKLTILAIFIREYRGI